MIFILLVLIINQALLIKRGPVSCLGCGILGFSGEIDYDPLKIKMLFLYNEQRGSDSCGIYTEKDKEVGKLIKKVGKSSILIVNSEMKPAPFLLGHTRKATVGSTSEANAHPFKCGKIVGVHNGGITNYIMLANSREVPTQDYWVDSHSMYLCMEKDGGFKKALEDYSGGAALLFTMMDEYKDEDPLLRISSQKLYAYHDKEKPLFHGRIKIGGKIGTYFSSMRESLEAIECSKIREFPTEVVHTFFKGKLIASEKIKRNPMVYKAPIVPEEPKHDYTRSSTRDLIRQRDYGYNREYDRPYYIHYVNSEIEPSNLGKSIIGSWMKHVRKARVLFADLTARTMTMEILELNEGAPAERYFAKQQFTDVRMEYFVKCTIASATEEAEEKKEEIEGAVPATSRVEPELSCGDFEDYRDQFWATLMTIREKAEKIERDGYWQVSANAAELKEFIEEEVFTMFSMNV